MSEFAYGSVTQYAAVFALIALVIRLLLIGSRGRNYPPGPRTLPIIGNLHQLPAKDLHLAYQEWGSKYGSIFHLKLGSQDTVVLTSGEMIKKVIDKKSANFADRPKLYMQDIWEGSRIIMRGYDDLWKVERKVYHSFLNINIAKKYAPYQDLETKQLCVDLLRDPDHWAELIARTTTSIATSMTYGFRVTDLKNPVMVEMYKNTHGFFRMVYTSKFLDWYPQLRPFVKLLPTWIFPLVRRATETYHRERAQFGQLYSDAKRGQNSDSLPSFASDILKAQQMWKGTPNGSLLSDHAASYIAGIAMEGASDTQSNSLAGFVKAMLLFPETQKKGQEEIDNVIGSDRLPTIEDYDDLPYLRCMLKETLRWMPTAIAGAIPHAAKAEDEVEGYTIPAGATVVLAVWAANNDPSLFPNPRSFNPSRHNPDRSSFEAATAADFRDRDHWTFGAGRRICPGMHVAERTMAITMARILWAFSIERARDENGVEVEVPLEGVTQSIAAAPLPFECQIKPRSEERAELLRSEWAEAEKLLDEAGNYRTNIL